MSEIHRIAGGNVSVFARRLRRGETFYARFKIANPRAANNQRYVTESLGVSKLDVAIDRAHKRYAEIALLEKQGRSVKSGTVAQEIDEFMTDYATNLNNGHSGFSKHMYSGFRKSVVRYFREYIGNKAIQDVSHDDLRKYEAWRQSYWANKTAAGVRLHGNVRERASARTLEWEINAFKQFLRWSKVQGRYAGNALDFVAKAGDQRRRSAFTKAQWNQLTSYMRRSAWLNVGKHGNDKRLRRHRRMLQAYVLFMANTGLRVGEARNLRWGDCAFVNSPSELDRKVRVTVSASYSKVNRRRTAIGTAGAYSALKRLLDERKVNADFARASDYVWCDTDGGVIKDFREGFNSLIREARVELDGDGAKLVIYSLRHTYITFRLQKGVDVYQLATNCGTSVAMIEKYYSDATSPDFEQELTKGYRDR